MEVCNVRLQVLLVFMPSYPVDSDRCRLLQIEESFIQTVFVDVMQQGGELELAAGTHSDGSAGSFAYAEQTS